MAVRSVSKKLLAIKAAKRSTISDLDKQVANTKEVGLRTAQNAARIREKLQARSSNKEFQPKRRDELADRDIFQEIQSSLGRGLQVRLVPRGGPGVIRRQNPVLLAQWKKVAAADRRDMKQHITNASWAKSIWIPHWDHTHDMLKGLAWSAAVFQAGGESMSLNLGPDVIDAAMRDPRGAAQHLRDRMTRSLKRALAGSGLPVPDFFFVVEASDLVKMHIHGGILIDARVDARIVRGALKKAGGSYAAKLSGRQLHLPKMETPVRWFTYITKGHLGSAVKSGSPFAATNGVRTLGKAWYSGARKKKLILAPGQSWSDFGTIPL
tara:strand:- start:414 stop:1382 length:969 start_codon:yes stop_codon:yes gene_type:complete